MAQAWPASVVMECTARVSAVDERKMVRASFRRDGFSRAAGCLVYTVVAPFAALCLALIVSLPVMFALKGLGVSEDAAVVTFPIVLLVMAVFVALWGIREYRHRAALAVEIEDDRVVVTVNGKSRVLAFAEVKAIRLVPAGSDMGCVLESDEGWPLRIPPELAPFSTVRDSLHPTLVAQLARRIGDQLAAGRVVEVRTNSAGVRLIVLGLAEVAFAGVLVPSIELAIRVARQGLLHIRQGKRGLGGGFLIHHDGLARSHGWSEGVTPWKELMLVQADDTGLVIESEQGTRFAASPYARDFWPAALWLEARLNRGSRSL